MADLYPLLRPLLFRLDPERAHNMTLRALEMGLGPTDNSNDLILTTEVAGLRFPNPIGLAAGFDKDARVPDDMLKLGFGFVEVGTLTPKPQDGNPKPRMFRLTEDEAVINRLGFNNGGIHAAMGRLRGRAWKRLHGLVGVNVGANKDSADRIADYEFGIHEARDIAAWITVNISSPNTPGLRALQSRDALAELLNRAIAAREGTKPPIFLKVAPDLTAEDIVDIAAVALAAGIDGLIVSNTTIARPQTLKSAHASETGGLSGAPLRDPALTALRAFRQATGGRLPLIGVGGIASGADAYARIRAGASLVQLYTALAYRGPGLVAQIKRDLATLLRRDGFTRVGQAVGADVADA